MKDIRSVAEKDFYYVCAAMKDIRSVAEKDFYYVCAAMKNIRLVAEKDFYYVCAAIKDIRSVAEKDFGLPQILKLLSELVLGDEVGGFTKQRLLWPVAEPVDLATTQQTRILAATHSKHHNIQKI
jgi:hypothetical protein